MNHYTRALAELKAKPAHKLGEVGDQWQTPPALFWGINAVFGPFIIDLFTDADNSKCPRFYTAENNAMVQDWAADLAGGKAFANPPYSRSAYDDDKQAITGMRNIMAKVMTEREKGARIVMLLKSATSEVWWPEQADHVAFVRGRISFDLPQWFVPATDKDKASSAGFAVAICVFDKEWRGQPMQYIERDTLLAQGNAIINMIEQRASALAQQYATATLEHRPDDAEPGEPVSNPCQLPESELSTDALQLPSEPEQAHNWPYEVMQIVDQALAFMSYEADAAFYERLCASCNKLLLIDPTQKLRTSNHIKTLISDKKQEAKSCAA